MNPVTIIPSLLHGDRRAFKLHTDFGDLFDRAYRTVRPLSDYVGTYDTCGDGTVQHGGEGVAIAQDFTDFCVSLTNWLLENPHVHGVEPRQLPYRELLGMGRLDPEGIEFLRKVRYREGLPKYEWFSVPERKVTTRDMRHDRRFHKVEPWCDGSLKAHIGVWLSARESSHAPQFIRYYNIAASINQQLHTGDWDEMGFDALCEGDHFQAWRALHLALDATENLYNARNANGCAIRNSTPKPETQALAA